MIDNNHIFKFDGSYFNIWKHRLIFKIEKLWSIVNGTKPKSIPHKCKLLWYIGIVCHRNK